VIETPAGILVMDVSKASDMIAVSSLDREHLLTLFDLKTGKPEAIAAQNQLPSALLKFSGDGKYLAGLQYGEKKAGDPNGKSWGTVTVWNLADRTSRDLIPPEQHVAYGLAWLADQKHVVSSVMQGPIMIWNVETGRLVAQTEGAVSSLFLEVSPDGKVLAVGQLDGTVGLFGLPGPGELEAATDKVLTLNTIGDLKKHIRYVQGITFSPDGRWLATSSWIDRSVWVWDFALRKPVHRLDGFSTAFSPDSRRLATTEGSRLSHQIAVWDVESGKPQFRLTYSDPIYLRALSFTSDGDFIVGGGNDTAIRTWDVRLEGADAAPR